MSDAILTPPAGLADSAGLSEPMEHRESPIWSDGTMLFALNRAIFPERCIKCNGTDGLRMKVIRLSWTPPKADLVGGILGGAVGHGVAHMLYGKNVVYKVGTCRRCRVLRYLAVLVGFGFMVAGFVVMGVGIVHPEFGSWTRIASLGCVLAGVVSLVRNRIVLRPVTIENEVAQLKGAGPAFLETLK